MAEGASSGGAAAALPLANLVWTWAAVARPAGLPLVWQRVNHLPALRALTRKDRLARRLEAAALAHGAQFTGITPQTFVLPADYVAFTAAFARAREEREAAPASTDGDSAGATLPLWIVKPAALSRGRGIYLMDDLAECSYGEASVVQAYVERPLLLDGFKWDLRLYVLVTSASAAQPEAWLYEEGLARFCTRRYDTGRDGGSGGEAFDSAKHLTNASLHASAASAAPPPPLRAMPASQRGGNKCSLRALWAALRARGVDAAALWKRVQGLVRRTLFATLGGSSGTGGARAAAAEPSGFELLGFDVLIDAQLRPWLLEVNASPSLEGGSALDAELKSGLLRDVVHILRPLPFNRTRLAAILRRRAREGAGVGGERARAQLNADLWEVLGGDAPRRLDEAPAETGLFRPLAPSPEWNALQARSAGRQRG